MVSKGLQSPARNFEGEEKGHQDPSYSYCYLRSVVDSADRLIFVGLCARSQENSLRRLHVVCDVKFQRKSSGVHIAEQAVSSASLELSIM